MSSNAPFTNINPNNPLTFQHLQDINTALAALNQAEAQANMANSAGIDVGERLTAIQNLRAQLLKFKNVYFPGQ